MNNLTLIISLLAPLSLLCVSQYAYNRLPSKNIKFSRNLWIMFSIKSLFVITLFYFNSFFLYPATWFLPLVLLKIYPKNDKWAGLGILCVMASFLVNDPYVSTAFNTIPFLVGFRYLKSPSSSLLTSVYRSICLSSYVIIFSSIYWIGKGFIWSGLCLEIIWVINFAVVASMKFMHETENGLHVEMNEIRKNSGEMLMTQSHLAELGNMCRGMLHEISNPLTIIQAKIHLLKNHYELDDINDQLDIMNNNTIRIRRSIEGMRLFYQTDKNFYEEFALKEVINDVLVFCGQRFQNYGVSVRTYGIEDVMVYARKLQLEQAILQLLNNAFEAIEFLPTKWIEISAKQKNSKVEILIKDSGKGIPEEISRRMMDPFYTTKQSGTGTGLSFTQGLLQKNGGDLTYIKNSKHTLFKVEIPCSPRMTLQ